MESLLAWGLSVTQWLQDTYPQLERVMVAVSALGKFEVYLVFFPLLYWCIHKKYGKYLAYLLSIAGVLNAAFKHGFRQPRPFWLDPTRQLGEADGYGLPSGHAQMTIIIYALIAFWVRRPAVWLLAVLFILLMGLSRIYLGVHFVHDVFIGYALGFLILLAYPIWMRYFRIRFLNRILGQRLLAVILVPVLLVALYVGMILLIGEPDLEVAWAAYVPAAELTAYEEWSRALGLLAGLGIGFILEASRVYFVVAGSWPKRLLRYLLGMATLLALWLGLGALFPDDPLWLAIPLRILRYLITGLWVAYYAPWLFVRLNLADTSPESEVKLTVSDHSIMRE
jgi:membrane-associated phospholipid phosphatase